MARIGIPIKSMIDQSFEIYTRENRELTLKDIMQMSGCTERTAIRKKWKIRFELNKNDKSPITLKEYRAVFDIR